ncbi:MAG: hypothetical protein WBK26_15235 [Burkholderiaceae bacterium]
MTTTPTTLIGLCGPAGSGKDSVRSILEMHNDFAGLAFAEPIREMLRELLTFNGCSADHITQRELKETPVPGLGVSYRHMAQTLGTEWGRNCLGENFWLRVADAYMTHLRSHGYRHFVVSDVRFANEAAWVRARGGVLWLIDRPGVQPVRQHISEAMPFEADRVLHNHGSLPDLRRVVHDALLHLPADLAAQRAAKATPTDNTANSTATEA